MGSRKLPAKGTKELEELKERYRTCPGDKIGEFSQKCAVLYGFTSIDSFVSSMSKSEGVKREPLIPKLSIDELTDLESSILEIIKDRRVSIGEISRQVDRSRETIIKTIDSLREKNYEVELDETSREVFVPQEPGREFKPTEFKYFKNSYIIGLVSDTHFCSRYSQPTLLYDAYANFNKRQVDFVLHAGDLVDGKNMYRGQETEVFKHGADEQAQYVVENYPRLERGRKTYIIGGQHDRSFYRDGGFNIVKAVCKERKDLVNKGFYKADFAIKGLRIELQHPGGGIAYALSYKPQKIIESIVGFVSSISNLSPPILVVFGHWHTAVHLPNYMGVDVVSLPCYQAQTPYLEQLGKMPTVGYAIAEIKLDKNNNLTSTKIEFINQNAFIKESDF